MARVTLASLARNFGWVVEDEGAVHATEAVLRSGGRVAYYADHAEGEGRPWGATGRVEPINDIATLKKESFGAAIIATYTVCDNEVEDLSYPVAIIRPKVLIMGLRSNFALTLQETMEEIESGLRQCRLAWSAVSKMAAFETDKSQEAFSEYARKVGLPIEWYTLERLEETRTPTPPSGRVAEEGETWKTVEALALLSACGGYRRDVLLVPETPTDRIVYSVARSVHPTR